MFRRVLLTLLCSAAICGVLSTSPVLARSPYLGSGFGTAADFVLRILLVPFLVSLALVISCDTHNSAGSVPFAVGPVLSFIVVSQPFLHMSFLWQQLPIWLLSVCTSIVGSRLGTRVSNSRVLRSARQGPLESRLVPCYGFRCPRNPPSNPSTDLRDAYDEHFFDCEEWGSIRLLHQGRVASQASSLRANHGHERLSAWQYSRYIQRRLRQTTLCSQAHRCSRPGPRHL